MTLLGSICNYFNNEISLTPSNAQTSLMFLGIHAAALTIAKVFFNRDDLRGYKKFLKTFIDGRTADSKFSTIAAHIHKWRNILAHQWLGSLGHEIQYDYTLALGWERRGELIVINPRIYCKQYLDAFGPGGRIWEYENILSDLELQRAKEIILEKYESA